jgi:hypothetical protein
VTGEDTANNTPDLTQTYTPTQTQTQGPASRTRPGMQDTKNFGSSKVHIEDIISFLFPVSLQHALVAGRLIVFGMYGPLDDQLKLRTGPLKRNAVSDWQLDLMCVQAEREDILNVYLHKPSDLVSVLLCVLLCTVICYGRHRKKMRVPLHCIALHCIVT